MLSLRCPFSARFLVAAVGVLFLVLPISSLRAELVSPIKPPVQHADAVHGAADAGDHEAQYQLSLQYFAGEGRAQSTRLGLRYLEAAAAGGHRDAQFNLGNYYNLYQENYQQAAYWWLQAAERGLAAAQFNLGRLYEHGLGVGVDRAQAQYWYELAMAQGDESSRQALVELRPVTATGDSPTKEEGRSPDELDALFLRLSPQLTHLPTAQ